jgi:hypothetical protein
MVSHPDVYEKLVASRHAQIRNEIQQIRMQAYARQQRTLVQFTLGRLGRVLIALGSYSQQTEQQNEASVPSS